MPKLIHSNDELMAEHDYARPHQEGGYRLHGGFDEAGRYISPRTLRRAPALQAWEEALKARGGTLLDASKALLARGTYPNQHQQLFLLGNGFGQSFWNSLTITGVIEARGQALVEYPAPKMQKIFHEDISAMCVGHLEKGLLAAHGMDEGGDPARPEIGAHDAMWFAVRDMIFGEDAYPRPEVPQSIGRPKEAAFFPDLPPQYDALLTLLMDVLMIEVRAIAFFDFCVNILRAPESFRGKNAEKERAAVLVDRIRQDEMVHIGYLRIAMSEMRHLTFRTVSGGSLDGKSVIDPVWRDMVLWHGETQFDLLRERARASFQERMPAALLKQFDALEDETPRAA